MSVCQYSSPSAAVGTSVGPALTFSLDDEPFPDQAPTGTPESLYDRLVCLIDADRVLDLHALELLAAFQGLQDVLLHRQFERLLRLICGWIFDDDGSGWPGAFLFSGQRDQVEGPPQRLPLVGQDSPRLGVGR